MSKAIVIKVGGSFFTDLMSSSDSQKNRYSPENNAENATGPGVLLHAIAHLQAKGQPVVLVHGGGEQVLKRLADLGIESTRINGLRMTPDAHMPIVCGVLAGELNKQLVATAAQYAVNAVGISLADGQLAQCHEISPELGAVGEPIAHKPDLLKALFSANIVPIVASIGKDSQGRLYNVNADHAAICIAELLDTELFFFADVGGVLDANKQVITEICQNSFEQLVAQKVITDGMIIKVEAALQAATKIQQPVTIASWEHSYRLLVEHQQHGTQAMPNAPLCLKKHDEKDAPSHV